jgi:hypothetical protein
MSDRDEFLGLVAIGLAHEFWRGQDAVEGVHIHRPPARIRRIDDGEMFTANVRITRICLRHLRDEPELDFGEMVAEFMMSAVPLAGDRTIEDLLGPNYNEWEIAVLSRLDELLEQSEDEDGGFEELISSLAKFAMFVAPHWWGGPYWPAMIDAFVDSLGDQLPPGVTDKQALRATLLEAPDDLGVEALEWCVDKDMKEPWMDLQAAAREAENAVAANNPEKEI